MADAGFFRGTSSDQDNRFSDKNKKLLKQMKFPDNIAAKVDTRKVNMDVLKPWITSRINQIIGVEDDVLIDFIFNQLEDPKLDPKTMQINLTGFLDAKRAREFMGELWQHFIEAQTSPDGIPPKLVEMKKQELQRKIKEEKELHETLRRREEKIREEAKDWKDNIAEEDQRQRTDKQPEASRSGSSRDFDKNRSRQDNHSVPVDHPTRSRSRSPLPSKNGAPHKTESTETQRKRESPAANEHQKRNEKKSADTAKSPRHAKREANESEKGIQTASKESESGRRKRRRSGSRSPNYRRSRSPSPRRRNSPARTSSRRHEYSDSRRRHSPSPVRRRRDSPVRRARRIRSASRSPPGQRDRNRNRQRSLSLSSSSSGSSSSVWSEARSHSSESAKSDDSLANRRKTKKSPSPSDKKRQYRRKAASVSSSSSAQSSSDRSSISSRRRHRKESRKAVKRGKQNETSSRHRGKHSSAKHSAKAANIDDTNSTSAAAKRIAAGSEITLSQPKDRSRKDSKTKKDKVRRLSHSSDEQLVPESTRSSKPDGRDDVRTSRKSPADSKLVSNDDASVGDSPEREDLISVERREKRVNVDEDDGVAADDKASKKRHRKEKKHKRKKDHKKSRSSDIDADAVEDTLEDDESLRKTLLRTMQKGSP